MQFLPSSLQQTVHYFMHLGIWVMYQIIGVTQLVSSGPLQTITFTSCEPWCHSAFNAFKSSIFSMACPFLNNNNKCFLWGREFQFTKMLFIDRCSLQCSRKVADAGDRYEAERGPEEALCVPKSFARSSEGESSV